MKDFIKVNEVEIGDTLDTSIGYTFTVTKIERIESKWSTPKYVLTGYNNIDDSKKEYTKTYFSGDVVLVIAKNFEYQPQIQI